MHSEQVLVRECLKGNQKACETLYYQYAGSLLSVCTRYVPQKDEAEDILQESFVKIFQHLSSFEFRNTGSLSAWMRRIVVNQSINHLRTKKRFLNTVDIDAVNPLDINIAMGLNISEMEALNSDELHRCISRLAMGYRTVFNLFVIEEYTHKEIAALLEISESTSKTQLLKARALLKKHVEELINQKTVLQDYGT